MTVFSCRTCRQRISPDLAEIPMPPLMTEDAPGERFLPSLMPRGAYAILPFSGVYVLNPEDVTEVARHPDRARLNGCCGLDGLDGPNLVCAACGSEVATQQSDCWSQQQIMLAPASVSAGD